ncbi:MAG: glycosyltransferase [Oscillospiraceae bacterium]|nr:glycosyltransferase [Oscillospiraceae bacterium]
MNQLSPKVSVIVPVYNICGFLPATLENIRAQTYRNLEIILVDDGSTDGSADICDQICNIDTRFQVFHRENGGVSVARNYALDLASGEYCVFIDGDDLVKPDYIRDMISVATSSEASIVICKIMWGQDHTLADFTAYQPENLPRKTDVPIERFRYTNEFRHYTVSAGLYSRALIGALRFDPEFSVGEDLLFFSRLLRKARNFAYIDASYYYATYRKDSATHAVYNPNQFSEILAWETVCKEATYESEEFLNECYAALSYRVRNHYDAAYLSHYPDASLMHTLYRKAFQLRHHVYRSPYRSWTDKVKYALFLTNPRIYTGIKFRFKPQI